jgi:hypothetical protein
VVAVRWYVDMDVFPLNGQNPPAPLVEVGSETV